MKEALFYDGHKSQNRKMMISNVWVRFDQNVEILNSHNEMIFELTIYQKTQNHLSASGGS